MRAIAKTRPAPGVEIIEADEPVLRPGTVKIKLEAASVCGTDLHIYSWDPWAAGRIKPTRIIGHEFCGTIVEVASDVTDRKEGDFVASESHIVCGQCKQCVEGNAHVCVNTQILGVDVDGGFAEYAVVPSANARPTDRSVPAHIACFQDALGNAVHTVCDGPVQGLRILVTGMGPIGAFAVNICKALGAAQVVATEVSPFRADIAKKVGADIVLDPRDPKFQDSLAELAKDGFDAHLEMSGHPSQLALGPKFVRPGGRMSVLGVFAENMQTVDINAIVFKGIKLQGIVGRKLWETWDTMGTILSSGKLNLEPIITHQMHYTKFAEAMELMKKGEAGKVVFTFEPTEAEAVPADFAVQGSLF